MHWRAKYTEEKGSVQGHVTELKKREGGNKNYFMIESNESIDDRKIFLENKKNGQTKD